MLQTEDSLVEEERITGLRSSYKPMHGSSHILPRRDRAWITSFVGEDNHVVLLVASLHQEALHIVCIVPTSSQGCARAYVVDTDQEGFTFSRKIRVLKLLAIDVLCAHWTIVVDGHV